MPCGFLDGLPIGLQIIGHRGREDTVLRVCRSIERSTEDLQKIATDPGRVIEETLAGVDPMEKRKMVGGNAAKLYKLEQ